MLVIDPKDINLGDPLASGSYGVVVYKGGWNDEGQHVVVAIKQVGTYTV